MMEEWRDIPGIPDYQASNMGSIRGTGRLARVKGGFRSVKPRVLSCFPSKSTGYAQVDIRKVRHSVHRLVALAWCSDYFPGAIVDHVNGIRDDNRAENLNWVTYSENTRRSFVMGRETAYRGKFSSDHPTSKAVMSTCIATGAQRRFESAMDAVREGFDSSSISRCCTGKVRYHKGHYWRFAADETNKCGFLDLQERAA